MQLFSRVTSYSSVVGGGLMLVDRDGRARFIVMFRGTTEGITKEENDALARAFDNFVNTENLTVPDRKTEGG